MHSCSTCTSDSQMLASLASNCSRRPHFCAPVEPGLRQGPLTRRRLHCGTACGCRLQGPVSGTLLPCVRQGPPAGPTILVAPASAVSVTSGYSRPGEALSAAALAACLHHLPGHQQMDCADAVGRVVRAPAGLPLRLSASAVAPVHGAARPLPWRHARPLRLAPAIGDREQATQTQAPSASFSGGAPALPGGRSAPLQP